MRGRICCNKELMSVGLHVRRMRLVMRRWTLSGPRGEVGSLVALLRRRHHGLMRVARPLLLCSTWSEGIHRLLLVALMPQVLMMLIWGLLRLPGWSRWVMGQNKAGCLLLRPGLLVHHASIRLLGTTQGLLPGLVGMRWHGRVDSLMGRVEALLLVLLSCDEDPLNFIHR